MRPRVLKSKTIIPPALYVERSADRQLREILEDMGRPGYVLVARQMGKTNLLLNAKRYLQKEDVFVYMDLSNRFQDIQQYFQAVIDTAVETNPVLTAAGVDEEVRALRTRVADLPHKAYERELRAILTKVSGKVVICLDEVDALTSCAFSDAIFSNIRTSYFARANFSEYERLTYILSGVAEPTELIKDKAISPFNIGEKIYLDDFNYEECAEFLRRAELAMEPTVFDRLLWWTGGNPRILWDVCSKLELCEGGITTQLLDDVVTRLYLTDFDLPPVDHIRKIAEMDKGIRDAVMAIKYGKGETVTDKIRARLYLSGIVSSVSLRGDMKIKNKIIEEALSDQWISSIERLDASILGSANTAFRKGEFAAAIAAYEEYFRAVAPSDEDGALERMELALCFFKLGRYNDAIPHLRAALKSKKLGAEGGRQVRYLLGTSYLQIANVDAAEPLLREVVSGTTDSEFHIRASVNLASCLFIKNWRENRSEIISLWSSAIQIVTDGRCVEIEDPVHEIEVPTLLNLSHLYDLEGDREASRLHRELAAEKCAPSQAPSILLAAAQVEADEDAKKAKLKQAAYTIVENDLRPHEGEAESYVLNEKVIHSLLRSLIGSHMEEEYRMLLDWLEENDVFPGRQKYQILLCASDDSEVGFEPKLVSDALELYQTAYGFADQLPDSVHKGLSSLLARGVVSPERACAFLKSVRSRPSLQQEDALALYHVIAQNGKHAGDAVEALDGFRDVSSEAKSTYMLAKFAEMRIFRAEDPIKQRDLAEFLEREIPATGFAKLFGGDAEQAILAEVKKILAAGRQMRRRENPYKMIGRNQIVKVVYADGAIVEKKFKHVQSDLIEGRCSFAE